MAPDKPLLLHGDCMELLSTLPEHSVDFICCDPPYGITQAKWDKALDLRALWQELRRVMRDKATAVLFAGNIFTVDLINSNRDEYRYRMAWVKSRPSGYLDANVRPMRKFEDIVLFSKAGIKSTWYSPQKTYGHTPYAKRNYANSSLWGGAKNVVTDASDGSRFPTDIIETGVVPSSARIHPTQKPVELLDRLIRTYCPPGGTVLDFCMGSGSTGVAALQCGRRFIGIELDEKYYKSACAAIECASASLPTILMETDNV